MPLKTNDADTLRRVFRQCRAGAAPVLCQRISSKCKGKQYPQLQLAATAADVSSSASGQTEL